MSINPQETSTAIQPGHYRCNDCGHIGYPAIKQRGAVADVIRTGVTIGLGGALLGPLLLRHGDKKVKRRCENCHSKNIVECRN